MRGRRRTLASVLAEALARRPAAAAGDAAIAVAFAEACGPQLARAASFRGVMADGRLLVLATGEEWATQLRALDRTLCDRVNQRLGRRAARGLDVRVASAG